MNSTELEIYNLQHELNNYLTAKIRTAETKERKKALIYMAAHIYSANNNHRKEPKYCIINKDTGATEETCETLKQAIEMLDYDTQYIYDTEFQDTITHKEF